MINNSIPTIESGRINPFGVVTKRNLPSDYWLKEKKNNSNQIQNTNLGIQFITPEEARKTHNYKALGLSIAGATILTAAGLFFILKGGPKGLTKNFQKLRDLLETKLQNSKLDNMDKNPKINRAYVYLIRKIDGALRKFEVVNNFTTVKDVLFKKLMYFNSENKDTKKKSFTRKIHEGITKLFEKIGRQSVVNSYNSTSNSINEVGRLCKDADSQILLGDASRIIEINGVRMTKAQWLSQIGTINTEINKSYKDYFGRQALIARYLKMKKSAEALQSHFDKLNIFWSKNIVNSFLAESEIAGGKSEIQKIVKELRRELSFSVRDFAKDADEKIIEMTRSIGYTDLKKINMLKVLRMDMKTFAKHPVQNEIVNMKIQNDIETFRKEIISSLKDKSIDETVAKGLLSGISNLKNSLVSFKQGKVENVLEIYKNILPESDYVKIEQAYLKAVKSLDKSVNIETEEFMSKLRDLSLGSAPTDVLTILGSLATLGYNLGKSDNNQERISMSLKYGIPAMAGIGVSLFCNARLFAGTKSLIIGTISTIVVNRIGTYLDKMFKKHVESAKLNASNSPVSQNTVLNKPVKAS